MMFKQLYAVPNLEKYNTRISFGDIFNDKFFGENYNGVIFSVGRKYAKVGEGVTLMYTDGGRVNGDNLFFELAAEDEGDFKRACRKMDKLASLVNAQVNEDMQPGGVLAGRDFVNPMAKACYIEMGETA